MRIVLILLFQVILFRPVGALQQKFALMVTQIEEENRGFTPSVPLEQQQLLRSERERSERERPFFLLVVVAAAAAAWRAFFLKPTQAVRFLVFKDISRHKQRNSVIFKNQSSTVVVRVCSCYLYRREMCGW